MPYNEKAMLASPAVVNLGDSPTYNNRQDSSPAHYDNSPVQRLEKVQIVLVQAELRSDTQLLNKHATDPIQMGQYHPKDYFPFLRTGV